MMYIDWNQIFLYDSGFLVWKISPSYRIKAGTVAGNKTGNGYWQVCYKGKFYKLHRIVWEMFNEPIPDGFEIDHIDRDLNNNTIQNLRIVTRSQNGYNRGFQKNSKTGVKGVSKRGNKFIAFIKINKKSMNLGSFNTLEEASFAYQTALSEVH